MTDISWTAGTSGNWSDAADWSGGGVPGVTDDATLGGVATYTVTVQAPASVETLNLVDANASLAIASSLTLGDALTVAAGTIALASLGMIDGGNIDLTGGAFTASGGVLSGVAVDGTLTLSSAFETTTTLTLESGTTFAGTNGAGAATINIQSGAFAGLTTLQVTGSGTLTNAVINMGGTGPDNGGVRLFNDDASGAGAVLTLGPSLVIDQTGQLAAIAGSDETGDEVINEGTINADYAGGDFTIDASDFQNNGAIRASNGGTVVFTGPIAASLISSVETTGGGLADVGGTVTGGVIDGPVVGSADGTLSGVTMEGTVDLEGAFETPNSLTVENGTTFAGANGVGAATIDIQSGDHAGLTTLQVAGSGTLANAVVDMGGTGVENAGVRLFNDDASGAGAVLTLGPSLVIDQTGQLAAIASSDETGDEVINEGTINADYAGGDFTIDASDFQNNGAIRASNGGTVVFTGPIAASLISSVETTGGGLADVGGTVTGGVIDGPVVGSADGTLSGVTMEGTVDLEGAFETPNSLTVENGTTFAGANGVGAATIDIDGADYSGATTLQIVGTDTLANAIVDIGGDGVDDGGMNLMNDDPSGSGATLTLGPSVTINQTGVVGGISSSNRPGDSVINQGLINADFSGGNFIISAQTFINSGTIIASNGGAVVFQGQIRNDGGAFDIEGASVQGSSAPGPTLAFDGAAATDVGFTGYGGTLALGDPFAFTGTISGLQTGDAIDLPNDPLQDIASVSIDGSGIVVNLTDGQTITLNTDGGLADDGLEVRADGNGGADLIITQYDSPTFDELAGPGTLVATRQNAFLLNLGTFEQSTSSVTATIAIVQSGPTGTLQGPLLLSGPLSVTETSGFTNSGFSPVGNVMVDAPDTQPTVTLSLANAGFFLEEVTFDPTETADTPPGSGPPLTATLPPQYLLIEGKVSATPVNLAAQIKTQDRQMLTDLATGAPGPTLAGDTAQFLELEDEALVGTLFGSSAQSAFADAIAQESGGGAPTLPSNVISDISTVTQALISGNITPSAMAAEADLQGYAADNSGGSPADVADSVAQTAFADALAAAPGQALSTIQAGLTAAGVMIGIAGLLFPESIGVAIAGALIGNIALEADLIKDIVALSENPTSQQLQSLFDNFAKDVVGNAASTLEETFLPNVYNTVIETITQVGQLLQQIYGGVNASGYGDVHLITYDGLAYDFQAEGEFVLAQSTLPGDTFQIQVRLAPVGSSSVTLMTEAGMQVGAARVTFAPERAATVWVDGAPSMLSQANPVVLLSGGFIVQQSSNQYEVVWNTGETATVIDQGSYLNVGVGLGPADGAGSVKGLLGGNSGQADDFQLANGTVLAQPITSAELYGAYANAWRVTQATSLLDYSAGQTTATLTNLDFPANPVTLSQLPSSVVAVAAQAVEAAGITDPATVASAELDYIETGDPSVITGAATADQSQASVTQASITNSGQTAPELGVLAEKPVVDEATAGPTAVTFEIYLTAPAPTDTIIDYQVFAPEPGDLSSSTFGGGETSGALTIVAGRTTGEFTLDVPAGGLGVQPNATLEAQISTSTGTSIFAPTAQTQILAQQAEPGSPAIARIAEQSTFGQFRQTAGGYALDLGGLLPGQAVQPIDFVVSNGASAPADDLSGTFEVSNSNGFSVTGDGPLATMEPGGADFGLEVQADTSTAGVNTEVITLDPTQSNATGFSGALTPVTLTITDAVLTPLSLTSGKDTVTAGELAISAASGTLSRGDVITPAGVDNRLDLLGGGSFDLALPSKLANIGIVDAVEGVGANLPTITLRSGLNVTVNLASSASGGAGAKIIGAKDASVINLGSGADTVVVGAAAETILGGGGKDTIDVTRTTIAATIDGGDGPSVLELTSGGTAAMGANITEIHSVLLKRPANFTANGLSGLTVTGSSGADTITAGGAGQILIGDGGADTLMGYSGGGDTFQDTAAHLVLDTIQGFVAGDIIDITNLKPSKTIPTTSTWSSGVLTVKQGVKTEKIALPGSFSGTFSAASDGKTGVAITYAAAPTPALLVQAMASLGADTAGSALPVADVSHGPPPTLLSSPHVA